MLADLHCHSLCSDGQLSPADLVDRAVEMGVSMLALTDHDTLNGLPEAKRQALDKPIEIINGIECLNSENKILTHDRHHHGITKTK